MLFYLTDSLIVNENDPRFNPIKTAVHHIAIHVCDGVHLLLGDIKAITYFRRVFEHDFAVGPLFNKIYQNLAVEVIPSFLTYYIEVVIDNPAPRVEGNVEIQQVLFSELIPLDATARTILMCEFLYDADIYKHVTDWYIIQNNYNVHYSFHKQDGGGTNLSMNIANEMQNHHIVLSIVDTDCRFPNDAINPDGTYGKCLPLINSSIFLCIKRLDVHEIENLIPLNYIDLVYASWTRNTREYQDKKKAFDYLKKDAENILPYFDYKNGIKYNDAYRNGPQDYRDFAAHCYMQNDDNVALQPDFNIFIAGLNNKDTVYSNLIGGTGTIKMTLGLIETGNVPSPVLFNYQRENWNRIGQVMLNWCISRRQEAIH